MEEYLRTYCEIDLKAIRKNYINIKKNYMGVVQKGI